MAQAALRGGIAVQRTEIAEQLASAGAQHGVAVDHCLMSDVLGKHRLADAVRPDKHDVGGFLEEVERDQRIDGGAVAVLGPGPVEVAEWFEAADMCGAEPTLQAAAGALLLLPVKHRRQPGLGCDLRPVRQQTMQMQRLGAGQQAVVFSLRQMRHRYAPSADRRFRVRAVCASRRIKAAVMRRDWRCVGGAGQQGLAGRGLVDQGDRWRGADGRHASAPPGPRRGQLVRSARHRRSCADGRRAPRRCQQRGSRAGRRAPSARGKRAYEVPSSYSDRSGHTWFCPPRPRHSNALRPWPVTSWSTVAAGPDKETAERMSSDAPLPIEAFVMNVWRNLHQIVPTGTHSQISRREIPSVSLRASI